MTTQHTAQILEHSQINFGTSGARGLVEHFTDEVCAAFTVNFLTALQQQGHVVKRLALGIDLRPSSQAMAAACAGAAKALGVAVDYYGVRMTLANHEIVHLRPSGNAPELRCYVETDSAERSALLVEQVLGLIKERIS